MEFTPRELTDARAMRALAHPTRLSLLEAMAREGRPLTATEAAELVGESPSSCSFHLRQLAKYGFVEEVAEGATGRRRPWKLSHLGLTFDASDSGDPETVLAASALERVMRDRFLDRAAAGLEARRRLPADWRKATGFDQFLLYVTADELAAVEQELSALLLRYHERLADPSTRPAGSRPVEVLALAYLLDAAT